MTKERIPISGDLGSKVKQLMEYAGWYEGRSVDISIAEKYYADHGVPMMKTTQRFYRIVRSEIYYNRGKNEVQV